MPSSQMSIENWQKYRQAYISMVLYFGEKQDLCRGMAWLPFQKHGDYKTELALVPRFCAKS